MDDNYKIGRIVYLIDRADNRLESLSSRAGLIVTSNAVLLAGFGLMGDKVFTLFKDSTQPSSIIIIINSLLFLTLILVLISMVLSCFCIVSPWKRSGPISKFNKRLYFHFTDTIRSFKNYDSFVNDFSEMKDLDYSQYALSYLWSVSILYHKRYNELRNSVRVFIIAIFFGSLSLLLALLVNLWR